MNSKLKNGDTCSLGLTYGHDEPGQCLRIQHLVLRIRGCNVCVHNMKLRISRYIELEACRLREAAYLHGQDRIAAEDLIRLEELREGSNLVIFELLRHIAQFKTQLESLRKEEYGRS